MEPLFGTLVWAMWRSLRLTFRKVLTSAENKKLFLTTMVQLITTATARQTDPALLTECLNIVRLWLLEPENGGEPQFSPSFGLICRLFFVIIIYYILSMFLFYFYLC